MGTNHYVDVFGFNADGAQVVDDVIAGRRYGHHDLGQPAPARLRILDQRGMTAGVKEHITLRVAQQVGGDRHLDHLAAVGVRPEKALAQP